MQIDDLMAGAKKPSHLFERDLNQFIRANSKYKNLDANNRKILADTVKKCRNNYLMKGRGVPSDTLRRDMEALSRDRIKLGMSQKDLDDIRDMLSRFKG
jgi:hypothetical protein